MLYKMKIISLSRTSLKNGSQSIFKAFESIYELYNELNVLSFKCSLKGIFIALDLYGR